MPYNRDINGHNLQSGDMQFCYKPSVYAHAVNMKLGILRNFAIHKI